MERGLRRPGLAVVMVGDNPASEIYVRNKRRACEAAGIVSVAHDLPHSSTQTALLQLIDQLNADDSIDGILVQLPLPEQISRPRSSSASIRPRTWTGSIRTTSAGSRSVSR